MAEPVVIKPVGEYTPEEWQRVEIAIRQGQQMRENKRKLVENVPGILPSQTDERIITTNITNTAQQRIVVRTPENEASVVGKALQVRVMCRCKLCSWFGLLEDWKKYHCGKHHQELKIVEILDTQIKEIKGIVSVSPVDEIKENEVNGISLEHNYSQPVGVRSITKNSIKPCVCNICNKQFVYPSLLARHKETHSNERPCICKICNKLFKTARILACHEMSHAVTKPYVCHFCNKGFLYPSHLAIHERAPCDETQYVCEICNTAFNSRASVAQHLKSHSKPSVCDICNKEFLLVGNLKAHLKTHRSERPYVCEMCNRRFMTDCHLGLHKMRQHLQ